MTLTAFRRQALGLQDMGPQRAEVTPLFAPGAPASAASRP